MRNIFDEKINENNPIKILVHTKSFEKELTNQENRIMKIIKISEFKFIKIIFSPIKDKKIKEILNKNNIEITNYECSEEFIVLKSERFSQVIHAQRNLNCLNGGFEKSIISGSQINHLDLFAGHDDYYDFFIIDDKDTYYNSNRKTEKDIGITEALEYIRILLVNNGFFYVVPHYTVDEDLYYLYRYKKIFEKFQHAWSIAVKNERNRQYTDVFHQLDSLSERLNFICRADDKVKYYSKKTPKNGNKNNALYHFGYLIMLITGALDDLAWVIKHLYKLNLGKTQIVLKEYQTYESKLLKNLEHKNKKLYEFLQASKNQSIIKLFYPIRDSLQHRKFIKGVRYTNESRGLRKNLFAIPKETLEWIDFNFSSELEKEYGIYEENDEVLYIEPYIFTSKLLENFTNIINGVLINIEWDSFTEGLTTNEIEELEKSKLIYEKGLGTFLNFDDEPIYF